MAELFPVSGMKIYIGGVKSRQSTDFVAADFAAESWTEIDGWQSVGAFGDAAQLITTSLVNTGRDIKQKGTTNAGSMQNMFAQLSSDPGQIAMRAAAVGGNKLNYAFRVDGNESATPSKQYFIGLVMGAQEQGGEANTIRTIQSTIEINSNIVFVPAT